SVVSSGLSSNIQKSAPSILDMILPCVNITPFGLPVVPDVWIIVSKSSRFIFCHFASQSSTVCASPSASTSSNVFTLSLESKSPFVSMTTINFKSRLVFFSFSYWLSSSKTILVASALLHLYSTSSAGIVGYIVTFTTFRLAHAKSVIFHLSQLCPSSAILSSSVMPSTLNHIAKFLIRFHNPL